MSWALLIFIQTGLLGTVMATCGIVYWTHFPQSVMYYCLIIHQVSVSNRKLCIVLLVLVSDECWTTCMFVITDDQRHFYYFTLQVQQFFINQSRFLCSLRKCLFQVRWHCHINLLASGRYESYFKSIILKHIIHNNTLGTVWNCSQMNAT